MGCKLCKYEEKNIDSSSKSFDFDQFFNEKYEPNGNSKQEEALKNVKSRVIKREIYSINLQLEDENTIARSPNDLIRSVNASNNAELKERGLYLITEDKEENNERICEIKFYNSRTKKSEILELSPQKVRECKDQKFILGGQSDSSHNDFEINDSKIYPRQLSLKIDNNNEFIIIERKQNTGFFYKIKKCHPIDKNSIIVFGNYQMFLTIESEGQTTSMQNSSGIKYRHSKLHRRINIQFLNHSNDSQLERIYSFSSKDYGVIKAGRSKSCDILFSQDEKISRVQFSLVYADNGWVIYDGDYEEVNIEVEDCDKQSKNGIWKLITERFVLAEGQVLKLCDTTLYIKMKERNV